MNQEDLSLKPLQAALESLEDILSQPLNEYIRDGVIQRFEFTFELSWKALQRYFRLIGREDIASGPKPIIREAGKDGLIDNVEAWLDFLEKRNISTHVYNDKQAESVYQSAKDFPKSVKQLLENLNDRKASLK